MVEAVDNLALHYSETGKEGSVLGSSKASKFRILIHGLLHKINKYWLLTSGYSNGIIMTQVTRKVRYTMTTLKYIFKSGTIISVKQIIPSSCSRLALFFLCFSCSNCVGLLMDYMRKYSS